MPDTSRPARAPWSGTLTSVHVVFVAGVGLSTTFVNVFLWRHGGGLGVVLHYHVALFAAFIPGGAVAGLLMRRTSRVLALRWGVALHAVFFGLVLFLGWRAPAFAWALGALMGLAMGFYYVAASVLVRDVTAGGSASRQVGAMDQARLAAMTVTPFAAALAIDQLTPARGYPVVFAVSFLLFVGAALWSARLRGADSAAPFALDVTLWRPPPAWRRFLYAQGLRGVRDGVFLFLAGVLVFERTRSEFELGLFALGSGALGWMATRWVAARAHRRDTRMALMGVGAALSVAAAVSLAVLRGRTSVVAFGLFEGLAVPLVAVPFSTESYALVERDPRAGRRTLGYMVAREIPLNLGRLAGVAVLLAVVQGLDRPEGLGLVLVGLALANVAAWLVLRGPVPGAAGGTPVGRAVSSPADGRADTE